MSDVPAPPASTAIPPVSREETPTAAILLIGDELLSGKIRDENGWFLTKVLRRRGVRLVEVATIGDDVEEIGRTLLRLCDKADIVFTSGGVGPTHDDKTLDAIARATARPLERHAEMEHQLRTHYGSNLTEEALRMADVPRGTQLRALPGWPVLRLDLDRPEARIYILPGVPALLRAKVEHLERIEGELPAGGGWHLALLHTSLEESKLAAHLDQLVPDFPQVDIGSYPRWHRDERGRLHYHVRITFEAPRDEAEAVEAARRRLQDVLPAEAIVDPDAPL